MADRVLVRGGRVRKTFKYTIITVLSLAGLLLMVSVFYRSGYVLDFLGIHIDNPLSRRVTVPESYSQVDANNNGIADPIDIVNAARKEVEQRTTYKSVYYAGGYPPDDEGVCTDVIWRGLLAAGINLKDLMDEDIANNIELYPRTNGKREPNIDFRRVGNQYVFFERYAETLATEVIPGDIDNLEQWQPGDIVVFEGLKHVAIISDRRAKDGTPYIIHNSPPYASEVKLKSYNTPIEGHYRWRYED
ncbi:DUF1287 domain-containing protein [Alkalicella caledoniensis]|uniref:DUF1287 domain-containing protein n=1 Tax=Alkalicella caledoniensis TaxID=2731377 RepID=A0A7G9W7N6_ALKCA|nr:DUF1287 domain-containing protein [Alkalicella caledoniensis]QNO14698.1 DUF1287 domain-containing protein [Alkalicella caledoniensis]